MQLCPILRHTHTRGTVQEKEHILSSLRGGKQSPWELQRRRQILAQRFLRRPNICRSSGCPILAGLVDIKPIDELYKRVTGFFWRDGFCWSARRITKKRPTDHRRHPKICQIRHFSSSRSSVSDQNQLVQGYTDTAYSLEAVPPGFGSASQVLVYHLP